MNLGFAIKSLRKKKGINQTELAKEIGITQTSVSQIESGETRPSTSTMKVLSNFFNIPEVYLYFLALEEDDIPENKKEYYKVLVPDLKNQIEKIFS